MSGVPHLFHLQKLSCCVNRIMENLPGLRLQDIVLAGSPSALFSTDAETFEIAQVVLKEASVTAQDDPDDVEWQFVGSQPAGARSVISACFVNKNGLPAHLLVPSGRGAVLPVPSSCLPVQLKALTAMMQFHAVGRDICLVGNRGEGKTFLVHAFASVLGYNPLETAFMFSDASARDILQRRTMAESGATMWEDAPLVRALRCGGLAVLDGIDRLVPGTLGIIRRLLEDREVELFDGTVFVRADRYDSLIRKGIQQSDLEHHKVVRIPESFRVIAIADRPTLHNAWLTSDVLHMFLFHSIQLLPAEGDDTSLGSFLAHMIPDVSSKVVSDLSFLLPKIQLVLSDGFQNTRDVLSIRQIVRVARRVSLYPHDLHECLCNACMAPFMPQQQRQLLLKVLEEAGVEPQVDSLPPIIHSGSDRLVIGNTTATLFPPTHPGLVPDVVFFDIPSHRFLLESLLKDFQLGEHILLVGNQGVGKNKLADRLLQLLQREREYIQLHRDTTVTSLTLSPSLRNGKIYWEDSPLVKAMNHGRVLIIDEADKAPLEVGCVLKTLLADGEIILGNGVRFVTDKSPLYDIKIAGARRVHPNFRIFALANRPGYPFLGNDFFSGICLTISSCDGADHGSSAFFRNG